MVVQSKDNLDVRSKGLTKEGLIDSITNADVASHCAMMQTISHFYPTLTIISEEATTVCGNQSISYSAKVSIPRNIPDEFVPEEDLTVWIDPLDATFEYTEKLYEYVSTMVCVAVKGRPIIGIIHKPFDKTTSWAWVGKIRSIDLELAMNKNTFESDFKVIVSRSHKGDIEKVLKENIPEPIKIVTAAGAGFKSLEVATGKVDAYLHVTMIKKWDICAGNAIINSVGGKMTTKHNKDIDYSDKMHVENHDGLIATIRNHGKFLGKI
ncbi:unnamed protein product [Phaedon cochleariae]|nr:unnamed protein product [Phaedon cochleariae]